MCDLTFTSITSTIVIEINIVSESNICVVVSLGNSVLIHASWMRDLTGRIQTSCFLSLLVGGNRKDVNLF